MLNKFLSGDNTKKIILELSEEKYKFEAVFNSSPNLIIFKSKNDKILDVNKAFLDFHGVKKNKVLGKSTYDVVTPKSLAKKVRAGDLEVIRTGKPVLRQETVFVSPFSKEKWYALFSKLPYYKDNEIIGTISFVVDITDRKESENKILKVYSLLESTVHSTADGILVVDRQGKVEFNNKKFEELWRIPQKIISSKDDKKLLGYVVNQLSAPKVFLEKVNYLYSHSEEESFDVVDFKDGRIFERYSCPRYMGKEIAGRVWSFRDVTETKKSSEKLHEKIEELERFKKLIIGREMKMIELKEEIARLRKNS